MKNQESKIQNKSKKAIYKKWWFWLIILFILICIIGSSSSNNTKQNNLVESNSSSDIWSINDDGDLNMQKIDSSDNSITLQIENNNPSMDIIIYNISKVAVDDKLYSVSDGENGFEGFPLKVTINDEEKDFGTFSILSYFTKEYDEASTPYNVTFSGDFKKLEIYYDEPFWNYDNNKNLINTGKYTGYKLTITKK